MEIKKNNGIMIYDPEDEYIRTSDEYSYYYMYGAERNPRFRTAYLNPLSRLYRLPHPIFDQKVWRISNNYRKSPFNQHSLFKMHMVAQFDRERNSYGCSDSTPFVINRPMLFMSDSLQKRDEFITSWEFEGERIEMIFAINKFNQALDLSSNMDLWGKYKPAFAEQVYKNTIIYNEAKKRILFNRIVTDENIELSNPEQAFSYAELYVSIYYCFDCSFIEKEHFESLIKRKRSDKDVPNKQEIEFKKTCRETDNGSFKVVIFSFAKNLNFDELAKWEIEIEGNGVVNRTEKEVIPLMKQRGDIEKSLDIPIVM